MIRLDRPATSVQPPLQASGGYQQPTSDFLPAMAF